MRYRLAFVLLIGAAHCAFAAGAGDLADTSWRLVEIQSMDDSVTAPADASRYTLEFMADGTAALQADCNRGTGSWTSESANDLRFGPIASTRAMCPPGSLSDKYLGQFERVRSYVIEDGRLFLATVADGSIVEFEPAANEVAAATVLGEDVRATDPGELQQAILTALFDQYAAEQGIEAEPAEIDAYLDHLRRGKAAEGLTAEADLTPEEATDVEAMETTMAASLIRQWKINKALHDQYGGRIIYQQLGPEPLDVCGRPFGCKWNLGFVWACDQVRSCVRPRRCGLSCAAGLYGDMQIRTSSLTRARWRSVRNAGSPDPVS